MAEKPQVIRFQSPEQALIEAKTKEFEALWAEEARNVLGFLRGEFRYMPPDLLESAVNDGFLAAWNVVAESIADGYPQEIEISKVYTFAKWSAIDAHRVYTKRGKSLMQLKPTEDMIVTSLGAEMPTGPFGSPKFDQLMTEVQECIASLPDVQQRVALILAANWEHKLTSEEIMESYQKSYRLATTPASVKKALSEIKRKLEPILLRLKREKPKDGPSTAQP